MNSLVVTLVVMSVLGLGLGQEVYAWPEGTTEAQKDKILSVTSDDQLSVEES